jgi:S1-C subfamily serine protease
VRRLLSFIASLMVVIPAAFLVYSTDQIKVDFINGKRPLVMRLTGLDPNRGGTGFYVQAPSGKVFTLTNGHVCGLAVDGKVYARGEEDTYVQEVIEIYKEHDLCILTAPSHVSGIKIASSVRESEDIFVIGHPLLEPKTLVRGEISGVLMTNVLVNVNGKCDGDTYRKVLPESEDLSAIIEGVEYYCVRSLNSNVISANILPGNSGSPVLNAYGHLVGVVFAGRNDGPGRGYIVPLEDIKKFLEGK